MRAATWSEHPTISGRKKDIIIRKGENIAAKQLEDLIAEIPQVKDVAVVGVPDAARDVFGGG